MSLLMSDSLKGVVNLKDLEDEGKPLKIDTSFYCLFNKGSRTLYTQLEKFVVNSPTCKKVVLSTGSAKPEVLKGILDTKNLTRLSLFLSGHDEDTCIYETNDNAVLEIESIERESLSGYNYLITIIIRENVS